MPRFVVNYKMWTDLLRLINSQSRMSNNLNTYFIKTYGCQMNYSDSQRIHKTLEESNLTRVDKPQKADVLIVNTCAVRQRAEDKVIGWINNQLKLDPKKKIAITGCMLRRDYKPEKKVNSQDKFKSIKRKVHGTVIGFDIRDIKNLPKYLESTISIFKYDEQDPNTYLEINPKLPEQGMTAYIPIMTGCNEFCSYCIVPFSRGEEVSRAPDSILKEIHCALQQGKRRIVLLGQIVDKWSYKNLSFIDLLEKISEIDQDFWLTFLSPHPKYISNKILDFIVEEPKMLKSLSLPLQSGSNRILKSMNRKYTVEEYIDKIEYFRKKYNQFKNKNQSIKLPPQPYITTDIIVGFPGETKEDYNKTYNILKKLQFNKIFAAYYSPRPQSPAYKSMQDTIPHKIKRKRKNKILALSREMFQVNNRKLIGKEIKGMIKNKKYAHLYNDQFVELENSTVDIDSGTQVNIKIITGTQYGIEGKILT